MGRLKKYLTEEEKSEIRRKWSREYYWKNKEQCDEKQRKRNKKMGEKLS